MLGLHRVLCEFLPKARDTDIHASVERLLAIRKKRLQQKIATYHSALGIEEYTQQLGIGPRQLLGHAIRTGQHEVAKIAVPTTKAADVALNGTWRTVCARLLEPLALRAPQDTSHSRNEFSWFDGLSQVVVCPLL